MSTITMEKPELKKTLSDLLCSAFEGGSGSWYAIDGEQKPEVLSFRHDEKQVCPHLDYPLNDGGALVVQDLEKDKSYELTLESCLRGWDVLRDCYPKQWAAAMFDGGDSETGDIYLQCCLFGEVIYG